MTDVTNIEEQQALQSILLDYADYSAEKLMKIIAHMHINLQSLANMIEPVYSDVATCIDSITGAPGEAVEIDINTDRCIYGMIGPDLITFELRTSMFTRYNTNELGSRYEFHGMNKKKADKVAAKHMEKLTKV